MSQERFSGVIYRFEIIFLSSNFSKISYKKFPIKISNIQPRTPLIDATKRRDRRWKIVTIKGTVPPRYSKFSDFPRRQCKIQISLSESLNRCKFGTNRNWLVWIRTPTWIHLRSFQIQVVFYPWTLRRYSRAFWTGTWIWPSVFLFLYRLGPGQVAGRTESMKNSVFTIIWLCQVLSGMKECYIGSGISAFQLVFDMQSEWGWINVDNRNC